MTASASLLLQNLFGESASGNRRSTPPECDATIVLSIQDSEHPVTWPGLFSTKENLETWTLSGKFGSSQSQEELYNWVQKRPSIV